MKKRMEFIVLLVLVVGCIFIYNMSLKNDNKLVEYFINHDYYYDSITDTYKRQNIPLYSVNLNKHIYELNAFAKGIYINVKYNYNKKISDILYTIDGITKSATYNHNNDTFTCDDNKEICNTMITGCRSSQSRIKELFFRKLYINCRKVHSSDCS